STDIHTLSLHDALPILSTDETARFFNEVLRPYVGRIPMGRLLLSLLGGGDILSNPDAAAARHPVFELRASANAGSATGSPPDARSEEHTSELQSRENLV